MTYETKRFAWTKDQMCLYMLAGPYVLFTDHQDAIKREQGLRELADSELALKCKDCNSVSLADHGQAIAKQRSATERLAAECGGCPKGMKYMLKTPPEWCSYKLGCNVDDKKIQCWSKWAEHDPE